MPHVLMVDDNPGDLQLIEEAFKDCRIGITFHAAPDAAAALAYLERSAVGDAPLPDVLILDLNMPGMHGSELVANLRARDAWRGIPVVVFSGERGAREAGLEVDEVVAKPGSYQQYLALARRLTRYWSQAARPAARPGRSAPRSSVAPTAP